MNHFEKSRRRIRDAHPKEQPEIIRQEMGEGEARIEAREHDAKQLKEEWIVERSREGEFPDRDAEPYLVPAKAARERFYRKAATAFLVIEIVVAASCSITAQGISMFTRFLAAIISVVFAILVTHALRGHLAALLGVNFRSPQDSRPRLNHLAGIAATIGMLSLIPILLAQRGGTDESLNIALPLGLIGITAGFSVASGAFNLIADSYTQVTARTYIALVHQLAKERLFLEELERRLREHPFNHRDPDEGGGAFRLAAPLVVLSLLLASPSAAYESAEIIRDITGTTDSVIAAATVEAVIASLPALVHHFNLVRLEASPWGRFSIWAPPAAVFAIPPRPPDLLETARQRLVPLLFPALAHAREVKAAEARRLAQARAESLWVVRVEPECVKAGNFLRGLAQTPPVLARPSSSTEDLLARCSRQPANRLTIAISDFISTGPAITILDTSQSHTIFVVVPSRYPARNRSVRDALVRLHAPWLTVIAASEIDAAGSWITSFTAPATGRHPVRVAGVTP